MSYGARRRNAQGFDEDEPLLEKPNRTPQKTSGWDQFDDPPREEESASMADQAFFEKGEKLMKIVAYIVTFAIVLSSAVISKGTLLFMTSQVLNDTKAYCNEREGRNKEFEITIPQMERTAWIWSIIFAFLVPQLGIFVRSLRICVFKNWERPNRWDFFVLFVTETMPSVGMALLVFCVLPELDVIKGAMLTNAVCFIPGVVGFISRSQKCPASSLRMILDVVSIFAQASSFVVWPMVEGKKVLWLIPVSVLMISFGWWENYVSEESPVVFIRELAQSRKKFSNSRYYMYMFVSVWKALVFFVAVLMIFWLREGSAQFLFDEFYESFSEHGIFIREIEPIIYQENMPNISDTLMTDTGKFISNDYNAPVWVFLINIASTYVCYIFGKFACKILIQGFSYAFPICLAMPVTISALIAMTSAYTHDECKFTSVIPAYLFFDLPPVYNLKNFIGQEQSWIWLIWLLSQIWITVHIWSPTSERLARTEKLYVRPMYDPFLIDQDIALNRRREPDEQFDDEEETNNKENELMRISETDSVAIAMDEKAKKVDYTTRIFACGTMWHETKEEMMAFLKSIMRLDADQSARRLARDMLQYDADYYELETHVFFDDAFLRKTKDDPNPQINMYVKDLVESIREAASKVHGVDIDLYPPQKCSTPYGGRLVWTLPGRTKLIAHLKDKKKIRAKKRWSQVMYMYYLLGHRLADLKIPAFRKDLIGENTYILALDGDIDFQPKAVTLLVDLMKKNSSLGAACGRIHPIGSGPMVWYQKFEYAVGHWLQKATEHMIGCVLCSPGCFSLFRGSALMSDNVMRKYTTRSTEALHYVQYDQGEDRWLCTLMLQKGYRVEYSAASDAYTHCPEGFNEFYNQRRRWMPSTTANILDLLMDYKHTIKVNDNISRLYIAYQVVLMIGTVLGPGTIFLMLVGAFVAAFQLDQWSSFLWNIVPILTFLFVCKVFKKDSIQLFFAGAISAIYGLIMMAVLVGVMLQISSDGFLAPSSLFFFCVAGEMIITALLHPKELDCLLYGVVYYVTVPSMYMLLVIYSVFNMNNVSWGTREVTVLQKPDDKTKAPEPEKEKTLKEKMLDMLSKSKDDAGTFDFSVSGVFRCMLCTREANPVERYQLDEIKQSIAAINKKLDNIANGIQEEEPQRRKTVAFLEGSNAVKQPNQEVETESSLVSSEDEFEEDWLDDPVLEKGVTFNLPSEETYFWNGLLEKYLHPIDDTKDKDRIAKALIDLRDKSVAAFFMLNALFVLIVFLLTLKKDLLHVKWPFSVKTNFTYSLIGDRDQIELNKNYLQLEPIGLVFLVFFAILLVVQFIAMLFHRFATLCQILSNTTIDLALFNRTPDKVSGDENLKKNYIDVIKAMQKLKDDDDEAEDTAVRRKTTMADLEARQNQKKQQVRFLDDAYMERSEKLERDPTSGKGVLKRRGTVAALQRRTTVAHGRPSMVNGRPSMVNGRPSMAHGRPSGLFQKNGGIDNAGFSMETET